MKLITKEEARAELLVAVSEAGGVCAFADKHGLNQASVSLARNSHREVTPRIAAALGLEPVSGFRRLP